MKDVLHSASPTLSILIDSRRVDCEEGASVARVLLENGHYAFSKHQVDQTPSGPFCMMGACQACRVTIDGRWRLACQVVVYHGLQVQLADSDTLFSQSHEVREEQSGYDR
ncbi:MAG: (2Fe-2S)-binding protein [Granulosicoccus sp.]